MVPGTQKAGLRLDTLGTDFASDKELATWIRVHDKLVAGEMPPAKKRSRQPDELKAATDVVAPEPCTPPRSTGSRRRGAWSSAGSTAPNTRTPSAICSAPNVSLKEMLPDDNASAGFDNVGAVLDVSATHQLLYQEAAEKAVAAVIPPHPPIRSAIAGPARRCPRRGRTSARP